MKLKEIEGKKILIIGSGVEGLAAREYLLRHFPSQRVDMVDLKDGEDYLDHQMEYDLAVRLHFLLMAIAITLVATPRRNDNWFVFAFWELSIYNVFDELMGGGDSYVWYELPLLVIILFHSWYKFKK